MKKERFNYKPYEKQERYKLLFTDSNGEVYEVMSTHVRSKINAFVRKVPRLYRYFSWVIETRKIETKTITANDY